MDIKAQLHKFQERLQPYIEGFFLQEKEAASSVSPEYLQLIKDIEEFTLRPAKRLRPALMYFSYKLFGGKDDEKLLKTSVFIEVIHSYLLMHDDIIDRDGTRRGGDSFHQIYGSRFQEVLDDSEAKHLGKSIGIIAGDVANHLATRHLIKSGFESESVLKALEIFQQQLVFTGIGEMHDVLLPLKEDPQDEDVLFVHKYKTAIYTYQTPLLVGAILAGETRDEELAKLTEFAIPAGIAFQIQDDILGMFGDEQKLGKPADSDLKEGRETLLTIYASKEATKEQREFIETNLGNQSPDIEAFRELLRETRALDYSIKEAKRLVKSAKESLDRNWSEPDPNLNLLYSLADYMIEREF